MAGICLVEWVLCRWCRVCWFFIGKGDFVKIAVFGFGYVGTVLAVCLFGED